MCILIIGSPLVASEATTASKQTWRSKYDIKFEIIDLNYICDPSFKVTLLVKK